MAIIRPLDARTDWMTFPFAEDFDTASRRNTKTVHVRNCGIHDLDKYEICCYEDKCLNVCFQNNLELKYI